MSNSFFKSSFIREQRFNNRIIDIGIIFMNKSITIIDKLEKYLKQFFTDNSIFNQSAKDFFEPRNCPPYFKKRTFSAYLSVNFKQMFREAITASRIVFSTTGCAEVFSCTISQALKVFFIDSSTCKRCS